MPCPSPSSSPSLTLGAGGRATTGPRFLRLPDLAAAGSCAPLPRTGDGPRRATRAGWDGHALPDGAASCRTAYPIVTRCKWGEPPTDGGENPRRASRDHCGMVPAGAGAHTGGDLLPFPRRGGVPHLAPPRPLYPPRAWA